jgi:hypothetical protein
MGRGNAPAATAESSVKAKIAASLLANHGLLRLPKVLVACDRRGPCQVEISSPRVPALLQAPSRFWPDSLRPPSTCSLVRPRWTKGTNAHVGEDRNCKGQQIPQRNQGRSFRSVRLVLFRGGVS